MHSIRRHQSNVYITPPQKAHKVRNGVTIQIREPARSWRATIQGTASGDVIPTNHKVVRLCLGILRVQNRHLVAKLSGNDTDLLPSLPGPDPCPQWEGMQVEPIKKPPLFADKKAKPPLSGGKGGGGRGGGEGEGVVRDSMSCCPPKVDVPIAPSPCHRLPPWLIGLHAGSWQCPRPHTYSVPTTSTTCRPHPPHVGHTHVNKLMQTGSDRPLVQRSSRW